MYSRLHDLCYNNNRNNEDDFYGVLTKLRPRGEQSSAVRRRHCVGGSARVNFGRRQRRRGGAGPKKSAAFAARLSRSKSAFSKIHEKISFYPQNFLMTF